ncbi:MAG: polysaccharide pyruvyl transferase CsaB [Clostridiales bacterium]|nr:MAG: polysaccharide pyruvyl transferase CsaB [Clostridiales bacterium]
MKLVCISGGAGAAEALASLRRAGIAFAELFEADALISSSARGAKARGKRLAWRAAGAGAEGIFCVGEAGLQAGLFALRFFRKTPVPVLAVYAGAQGKSARLCGFDALLFLCGEDRTAALRHGADPYRMFPAGEAAAALNAAARRKWAGAEPKGIVVCGSYGLGNLGDEAMLASILSELRRTAPDRRITVVSRNPEETRLAHCVDAVHSFALPALAARLRRARLFISGGGTLLTDLTSTRSLRYYLLTIRMAHRLGARVLLYGCGIGPITGEQNRRGTAAVLNRSADIVAVRDGASLALLAELGVTKPELIRSRDAAFSLRAEDMRAEASPAVRKKLAAAGKYAVYAVRPWSGDEAFAPELAAAAERLWRERGLTPVFLPMEPPRDLPLSRRIAEAVRAPSVLLDGPMTFEDAFAAVGGAALVVSMRLHALIAASIARVPFVGVSYDVKISSFMKDSGSPACVDYYGATADGLCAAAEYTLREKDRAFAPPAGSENADAVRKLLEG